MNELIKTTELTTMSSKEIAELTGKEHSHVMRDIRNLEEELGESKVGFTCQVSEYQDVQGKTRPMYVLDKEATLTLISGYSAPLRMAIIKRLQELEKPVQKPLNMFEMISFMALAQNEAIKKQEQLELKQVEIEKKVLEIESKQISIDTNFYTISGYANLHKLKVDTQEANRLGRIASKISDELEYPTGKAFDSKYGKINTYHVDILKMTFKN